MNDSATKNDIEQLRKDMASKDDLADLRKQINEDIKLHMGTLYEKFSSDVKLVAEQVCAIDTRLQRVEQKADLLIETVGELKMEVSNDREVIKDHEQRVQRLEHAPAR